MVKFGSVEKLVTHAKAVMDRLRTRAREKAAGARLAQAATRIKMALAVAIRWEFLLLIARASRALSPADSALPQTPPILSARDNEGRITATEAMRRMRAAAERSSRSSWGDERAG